ncbi:MAG: hypothetical protein K2X27_00570 [Candidatus Obscuribacterales bacterium]|nr:hypothetical protein [Candidatus Obscuribacterales bacterium]
MEFRVFKSDDGRMAVKSSHDEFVASFRHGEWVNDMLFNSSELAELPLVEDPYEALVIVKEAKKALRCL